VGTHLGGGGSWAAVVIGAVCATRCHSSSSSAMVRASSDGASARPRPRVPSPWSPLTPLGDELAWAAMNYCARGLLGFDG
jgi:hypothetical protein